MEGESSRWPSSAQSKARRGTPRAPRFILVVEHVSIGDLTGSDQESVSRVRNAPSNLLLLAFDLSICTVTC